MNLYGFLANKGVNFVDFLGDIVVTDQDDAYKKAVVDALEDIVDGIEIEWERFEITTNCNDFDEHNSWKLKIAAWPNIPPNTTDPQKKLILKLLKDLVGGVDAPPLELTVLLFRAHPGQSENIQNAECRCENKLRRGYISENVQIRIPIDSGRKDSDGYPIYDPETGNNFKPTLWHELVGHGILGHGHPKSRQNNEEYKKDGKGSAGGTPPDPAVEVENEARRALGLKERRPTYDNNKKDQQNRD